MVPSGSASLKKYKIIAFFLFSILVSKSPKGIPQRMWSIFFIHVCKNYGCVTSTCVFKWLPTWLKGNNCLIYKDSNVTTLECSCAEWSRSSEGNSHTVLLSLSVVSLCWPPQDSWPLLSSLTAKGDLILLITNKGKCENLGGHMVIWKLTYLTYANIIPFITDIYKASEPLFNETVLVKVATSDTTLKCHQVQTTQHKCRIHRLRAAQSPGRCCAQGQGAPDPCTSDPPAISSENLITPWVQ